MLVVSRDRNEQAYFNKTMTLNKGTAISEKCLLFKESYVE